MLKACSHANDPSLHCAPVLSPAAERRSCNWLQWNYLYSPQVVVLSLQTEKKDKSGKVASRTTIVEQQWQGGAPVEERVLAVKEDVDDDELELEVSGSGEM